MKDITLYINHIMDSCDRIAEYTGGMNYETFKIKNMVIDAVIKASDNR